MSYSQHFETVRAVAILALLIFAAARALRRWRSRRGGAEATLDNWDRAAWALLALVAVQTVAICPFRVTSRSMQPALEPGFIVLGLRGWWSGAPQAGQVLLFEQRGQTVIKRVLATPGQTVTISQGQCQVNGTTVPGSFPIGDQLTETLPPDHYFLLGDNLAGSADSRAFGPVSQNRIWGRAVLVLWPFSRWSLL